MKKKLLSIVLPIGILGLIFGGILFMNYQQKVQYQEMINIAMSNEAKVVYEEYILSYIDSNAFQENGSIRNYTVDKNSLSYNPMGGLMVKIILNSNSYLYIDFNLIDNGDGTYHSAYYSESPNLADMLDKKEEQSVKVYK
ncbi:DUF1310 family protein [Streptococcus loxodontisalivarius]|uniref:DUF1310 family protein n=1 Tax=Streptococcus loxodontisalivarius TaxID=1349415 RepID=A0ABS2PSQ9_9STRE|nr:DUF1310 family protein [Streptococcus loxodontisalivarius]MBM7642745.1 hypothetical protein [Streptococcus loxodontisalivarius]